MEVLMDTALIRRAADAAHPVLAVAEKGDVASLTKLVAAKPGAVNSTTRLEKNTALHIAASKGHAPFVQQFLDLCMDKNVGVAFSENNQGDTPLHLAARAGHLEVVELLIKYAARAMGIDAALQEPTTIANKEGNTPLHDAVLYQQSGIALKLLEVNPRCAHAPNVRMQSPLYIAAREGLLHVVKKINNQGLSTASVSTIGTALHQAVLGDSIRALEILVNNVEELVELTDSSGNNALHYAAWHNKARMISLLCDKNSTLAYKTNVDQHTPLHMVAKYGSAEAARELLKQCSGTIEMVDLDGRNAFHNAILNDNVHVLEILLKCELPEEILNKQDKDGNTPLHHAAKLHQKQSVLWLLNDRRINSLVINKAGHTAWSYEVPVERSHALSNAIDKGGMDNLLNFLASNPEMIYTVTPVRRQTVLHLAASKGDDWFLHRVLLFTSRNVGFIISKNIDGDTPFHLAVRAGHLEVVRHMIRYVEWAREIEPNLKLKEPLIMQNDEGNTLLHEAVIHDRLNVANSLLDTCKEVTWKATAEFIKEYHECADGVASLYDVLLIIRNGDGDTPLHLAVNAGNSKFVDELIKCAKVMNLELRTRHAKGAVTIANNLGNTPLHNAVLQRKSDIALKLLEANPRCGHMLNTAMQSPLYIAVRDGLTYFVKKIADQGLYVASLSTHGTALHQSVLGDNLRALEILLNRYEELVESTDILGNNALHYAAQKNNARMVSILLNKCSSLAYKQNDEKLTPLHTAAYNGSAEAAKELLKRYPDAIEIVDSMGRNAIHIATTNDKVDVLELLLRYVLPEEMVNQQDNDGNTPLHHAAKLFHRQPTLLLLNDRRVNPFLVNQEGDTPFAISCRTQILEMTFLEINLWKLLKKRESRRCKHKILITQQSRSLSKRSLYIRKTMPRDFFVATFMCMATFAATLTMPGGYSQQSGTAIVGHHPVLKIFIICNTISMCGSTVGVLYRLCKGHADRPYKMLIWTKMLIVFSGLAMIMSMLTAVYLTVAPLSRLVVYLVVAIGISSPFLAWLILHKSLLT